jgi:hypothetical protein
MAEVEYITDHERDRLKEDHGSAEPTKLLLALYAKLNDLTVAHDELKARVEKLEKSPTTPTREI